MMYRPRQRVHAFRWTGDREALRAWNATLPSPLAIHDCGPAGDHLAGPDVLFNWVTIAADSKDPLDQPERVYGDRVELGQWIVIHQQPTWVKGHAFVGASYTDDAFRSAFEEVP